MAGRSPQERSTARGTGTSGNTAAVTADETLHHLHLKTIITLKLPAILTLDLFLHFVAINYNFQFVLLGLEQHVFEKQKLNDTQV